MNEKTQPTAENKAENKAPIELVATKTVFLGIHEKAGSFTDEKSGKPVDYDNIEISVSDVPEATQNTLFCYGSEAFVIKVKAEIAGSVFGYSNFSREFNPEDWLGREIDIRYDKKGKVKSIVRL